MNQKRRTQRVIHFGLILFLVACSAPAATPPMIPTATMTAVPTTTPTPVPPTPTPVPPTSTPAPPTATPTQEFTLVTSVEEIVGTWHAERKAVYLRFYEDGTLHQSHSLDSLDNEPYAISEVQFEGTQMSLKETAVSGVPPCGHAPGMYEVRLLPVRKNPDCDSQGEMLT